MKQILQHKNHAHHIIHKSTRYRAFLHVVELNPYGKIVVPLNKIDDRFEYAEEVRFTNFQNTSYGNGLTEFVFGVAPIIYGAQTTYLWNKGVLAYELWCEYGIKCAVSTRSGNKKDGNLRDWEEYMHEYFPSYEVLLIDHEWQHVCVASPYEDEVELPANINRSIEYKKGDPRPRLNIWRD